MHAAAKVTFKLVARPGGDAIADTQERRQCAGRGSQGKSGRAADAVFAPGSYTVSARNAGEVFQRTFAVQAGQAVQVEVLRR
jgi:hypothetical protein